MSPMLRSREGHPSLQRPHRPARTHRRAGRPRQQPAVVVAPADPRPVLRDRSQALGQGPQGPRRRCCPPCPPTSWPPWPPTRCSSRGSTRRPRTCRPTSPSRAGTRSGPRTVEGGAPASIAYFSPEYGITEVLPQYSGGLGILAGDHLKSASDLGVPVVGVGLFYKTGYFKQSLNLDGWQQENYPVLDPDGLPLALLREPDGTPCVVTLDLPGGRTLDGPRLEGAGRPGAAAAARLGRAGQRRRRCATSPTGCTAAAASSACSRRCCSASAACARCGSGRG